MIRVDAKKAKELMMRSSEFIKMSRMKDVILETLATRIENMANQGRCSLQVDERNERCKLKFLFSEEECTNEKYDYAWLRDAVHDELEAAGYEVYFTFGALNIAWEK